MTCSKSTILVLGLFCTTAALALQDECPSPPLPPIPDGESWVESYGASVAPAEALHRTPPSDIPFDRLRVMDPDNAGPISFTGWVRNPTNNQRDPIDVEIENPVLVVTLAATTWHRTCWSENASWLSMRSLEQYTCKCDQNGGNIWFTLDGNMAEYLENDLLVDRSCLNPGIDPSDSQTPCNDAIFWGVPSVGMPYAFGALEPTPFVNPNDAGAWWQQFVVVAVADRSAFVRPSYNPTVGPGTKDKPTNNGIPIWDEDLGRYRLAQPGDPTYAAQQEILKDFVGYVYTSAEPVPPGCESGISGCEGSDPLMGPEGFEEWLNIWQVNSWDGGPDGINCDEYFPIPYCQFPFSSIGLTGDWQTWATSKAPASETLPALSEFLLKGDQNIYVVGTWPVAQYLAKVNSDQVPWCDSCDGDLNLDGVVNAIDLEILLSLWGTENTCANIDKRSAFVDGASLLRMLTQWGPCPQWPLPELRPAGCE